MATRELQYGNSRVFVILCVGVAVVDVEAAATSQAQPLDEFPSDSQPLLDVLKGSAPACSSG